MHHPVRYMRAVLAALLAAGIAAPACGGRAPNPPHPAGALALVIGARSNMPAPQLTDADVRVVKDSVQSGDVVSVVEVSGKPQLIATIKTSRDGCNSPDACAGAADSYLVQIRNVLAKVKATAPEADTLEAIGIAARAVAASSGPKHIIVIDSGLQTAGEMPLQPPGAMLDDPAAVAKALGDAHDVDPSLKGVDVLMTGVGDTYLPQERLPDGARQHLYSLWKTVLIQTGAQVTIDTSPLRQLKPAAGLPGVTKVPILDQPPPVQKPCIPIRADQVGFNPNLATFRDSNHAQEVLRPIADKLIKERLSATLVGTTALPEDPGPDSLSERRAEAVKSQLVGLGVSASSLTTRGVGVQFGGFVPDTDAKGNIIETAAVQNRLVIVEIAGSRC
jgi:outer membrane protein OmpA-like peptidoglycan-associated protein